MRTRRRRVAKWVGIGFGVLILVVLGFSLMGATSGDHTLRSVAYAQHPPHSGDHSPVWQRCGFYGDPIEDEHAVHSLEHGVVWIAFHPDLPADQIDLLRPLAGVEQHVIVSPYPGLSASVVVTGWGHQLSFDTVDVAQLEQAVQALRNSDQAPEPGGSCEGPNLWFSGGTGDPES
jgi:hypothetical protein